MKPTAILQTLQAADAHLQPDWILHQPAGYTTGVWNGRRIKVASSAVWVWGKLVHAGHSNPTKELKERKDPHGPGSPSRAQHVL